MQPARERGGRKPRVDQVASRDAKRKTLNKLFDAARAGDYKATVDTVAEGVDVHVKTLRGQTSLMLAAGSTSKGTIETVNFLIDANALIDDRDAMGWSPLHYACRNSVEPVVEILLQRQACITARAADGKTVAMLAAMDAKDTLVKYLIKHQAPMDKKDKRGWSVLFYACEGNRKDLVKWLIKQSASAKDRAKDGTTALMVAAEQGNQKIGERLIKAKASLNATTNAGNSCLMIALRAMKDEFVEWLIVQNADVSKRNLDDEDAIEIADSMGRTKIKVKLEKEARSGDPDNDEMAILPD